MRRVRYLVGQQRNASGMAEPGTEVVSDIEPSFIFVRQTLLRAEELLRAGNFRAAAQLLGPHQAGKGRPKHRFEQEAALLRWAARFWGAWDRFDYGTAPAASRRHARVRSCRISESAPTQAHRNLVITLAEGVPIPLGERVKHCRALAADLLANAERRLAEGRFEEVLVRVYRILELITTYRLFSHGIDAEQIDPGDPRLVEWQQTRKNSGEGRLRPSRALGRRNSAELLVFLEQRQPGSRGAMIAARLVSAKDWLGVNDAQLRNASILIHGLAGSSLAIAEKLPEILAALRDFFYEEHGRNRDLHEAARFPFLRQ